MSGPQFFETKMGRQFYDGTMPRIAKALESIATELEYRDLVEDIFAVLWDEDRGDWKELQSCADAVQELTLLLQPFVRRNVRRRR